MDKDKLKELTEKFMNNFPVEFTALKGQDTWDYHDIDMFHSYACHIGIDCFDFHNKKVEEEMPSLFLIPFERRLITARGSQFIQMGKDAGVLEMISLIQNMQLHILGVSSLLIYLKIWQLKLYQVCLMTLMLNTIHLFLRLGVLKLRVRMYLLKN